MSIYLLLLYLGVPSIAKRKEGEAIFHSMLEMYVSHRNLTVGAKIAMYLGGAESSKNSWAIIEERTAQLYLDVSENGVVEVNSERFLSWFQSIGISGDDPSEVEGLFYAFDDDNNGVLDHDELLQMLKYLITGHRQISGKTFHNLLVNGSIPVYLCSFGVLTFESLQDTRR